jgi:hypothetical protein
VLAVVSPNDTAADVRDEVGEWLRFGGQRGCCTTVLPRRLRGRRVARAFGDDEVDGGEVLPGFRKRPSELFGRGRA